MSQENQQAIVDELLDQILELRIENDSLKAENRRLGGTAGSGRTIQERTCGNCYRRLPDNPVYFPGHLEAMSENTATEARRYHCMFCREDCP